MAESQEMYIVNVMYDREPICKQCKLKYNELNVSPIVDGHGRRLGDKYLQEREGVKGGELHMYIKLKPISHFLQNYPYHEPSISC